VRGGLPARGTRARPAMALATLAVATSLSFASIPAPLAQAAVAVWRFAPALAPPPPAGETPAPYPVPVGEVGQISFWAPNRGLLIAGGTQGQKVSGPVPSGLYAYDGLNWHELASVCGGAKGRIAWAGPDEFWTISDQRAGQVTTHQQGTYGLESLSLCHFLNGQVVGSYAMPLGEPGSYVEMDAAACLAPDDCWFGGLDAGPPYNGSFHLHWNGSEVTAGYDSEDHNVSGMVSFAGRIYEGQAIGAGDAGGSPAGTGSSVIRTISPAGQPLLCNGAPSLFCDVFLFAEGHTLPWYPLAAYPNGVAPDALGGFDVATDGSPLGVGATQLWAGADPRELTPVGSEKPAFTILRDTQGNWSQIAPPLPAALAGLELGGSRSDGDRAGEVENSLLIGAQAIAPEPGS
jgi:hypothetical protein